jgi:BlaI family penicillinase repressor
MARPRHENPTPAELEVLKVLWERGPSTVREVREALQKTRRRAYTSVMSLLNVMTEKGLLTRRQFQRAFIYKPRMGQKKTLSALVGDLLGRAFEGSASALLVHLLDRARPRGGEIEAIHRTIESYKKERGAE